MIVLAIIVFAPSSWINQVQSNNVQTCNSFTGQLSQSLSQENTTVCNNAPGILAVAQTGMIIAIVLGVLGIALIVIGAIKNPAPRPQQQPSQPQEKIDQSIRFYTYWYIIFRASHFIASPHLQCFGKVVVQPPVSCIAKRYPPCSVYRLAFLSILFSLISLTLCYQSRLP